MTGRFRATAAGPVPFTPEEEAERDAEEVEALQQKEIATAARLSKANSGVRQRAEIEGLRKALDTQLESSDAVGAVRTLLQILELEKSA